MQAAVDDVELGINEIFEPTSIPILESDMGQYKYRNTKAAEGLSGEGAPGFITQADLLAPISSLLSVRSDTYRVRAHGNLGSSDDAIGKEKGAYCELIVQRLPEYVDRTDMAEDRGTELSPVNKSFGRRFKILRFRWMRESQL